MRDVPSNISATISHGIGPNPIWKKIKYNATAKIAYVLLTMPINATVTKIQEPIIPAEEYKINVFRPVLFIRRSET